MVSREAAGSRRLCSWRVSLLPPESSPSRRGGSTAPAPRPPASQRGHRAGVPLPPRPPVRERPLLHGQRLRRLTVRPPYAPQPCHGGGVREAGRPVATATSLTRAPRASHTCEHGSRWGLGPSAHGQRADRRPEPQPPLCEGCPGVRVEETAHRAFIHSHGHGHGSVLTATATALPSRRSLPPAPPLPSEGRALPGRLPGVGGPGSCPRWGGPAGGGLGRAGRQAALSWAWAERGLRARRRQMAVSPA